MALFSRVLNNHTEKERPQVSRSHSLLNNTLSPTVSANSSHHHHQSHNPAPNYSLGIKLESPPVILYGQPSESTGSIISGILTLDIKHTGTDSAVGSAAGSGTVTPVRSYDISADSPSSIGPPPFEDLELETVTLSLVQTIKYSKTFSIPSSSVTGCKNCNTRVTTLARWDVLTSTAAFPLGSHAYPFSHLLPGSLPPTSKLGSFHSNCYIKYELIAVGKRPHSPKETIVKLPLNIVRSILRGPDRNSLRVFPPTDVSASAVLPNVVYPKSTFPVELKLDNIVSKNNDRRWRMRKLTWRIEESTKVRAYTCPRHTPKLKAMESAQKKSALQKELSGGTSTSKSSNLHHSTIQSSMSFLTNPTGVSGTANPSNNNAPGDEDIEPEDETQQEVPQAPRDPHQSFLEDFVPSANNLEPSLSASSRGQSIGPTRSASPVTPQAPEENEGHLYMEETRTVNHGEIKSGWKSDFSGRGRIEFVADISAANFATGFHTHISKRSSDEPNSDEKHLESLRNAANVACDIDDPTLGVHVTHTLIVEVVVAEEVIQSMERKATNRRGDNHLTPVNSTASQNTPSVPNSPAPTAPGVPTGAARVLRMQFKLHLTERSGLGIAWDDEVPPTYEDVRTLSPPTYQESPRTATPASRPGSFSNPTPPPLAASRNTPGVLYGLGDTPGVGTFGLMRGGSTPFSIDQLVDLDDRIQDLTI